MSPRWAASCARVAGPRSTSPTTRRCIGRARAACAARSTAGRAAPRGADATRPGWARPSSSTTCGAPPTRRDSTPSGSRARARNGASSACVAAPDRRGRARAARCGQAAAGAARSGARRRRPQGRAGAHVRCRRRQRRRQDDTVADRGGSAAPRCRGGDRRWPGPRARAPRLPRQRGDALGGRRPLRPALRAPAPRLVGLDGPRSPRAASGRDRRDARRLRPARSRRPARRAPVGRPAPAHAPRDDLPAAPVDPAARRAGLEPRRRRARAARRADARARRARGHHRVGGTGAQCRGAGVRRVAPAAWRAAGADGMRARLDAAWATLRRDTAIFLSHRTRVVTTMFSALFSVVLFHFISRLVNAPSVGTPDEYFGFVVVGLAVLEVLTSVVVLPGTTVRQELVAGTFERLVLSPMGALGSVMALLLFPFVFSLVSAVVTIGAAALIFGLDLQWSSVWLGPPLLFLGALSFAPFGILAVALGMQAQQVVAGTGFVLAGISIVSGAYFPPSVLPDWLGWTYDVQPFSPSIELMRHVLIGQDMSQSVGVALLKLAGAAVVLLPLALWILGAALPRARRRGTLLEY